MALDYKQKYYELRSKMMENMDVSFRLGYEQGYSEGEKAAQAQAQAMQEQMMAAQAQGMGGDPGMPPEGQMPPGEGSPEGQAMEEQGMSSEGQMPPGEEGAMMGMAPELQSEENSSELDQQIQELESLVAKGEKPSVLTMRKAVNKITNLRKSQKETFKRRVKQTSSSQKKLVDNILKKWELEANEEQQKDALNKIIESAGLDLKD
jgi:hypothetical protein